MAAAVLAGVVELVVHRPRLVHYWKVFGSIMEIILPIFDYSFQC